MNAPTTPPDATNPRWASRKRQDEQDTPDRVPKRVHFSDSRPVDLTDTRNSSIPSPMLTHSGQPTPERPEGALSEPRVVEGMLSDILKHFQATESELCKLRKRLYELETTLTRERGESQRSDQDQREKLVRAKEARDSYVSVMTNQALDISTGICNVSGKLISQDDTIFVMERCGAPVCAEVAEQSALLCPIHPSEGIQNFHAIFSRKCNECEEIDPKKLIDTKCGHPTCIDCLRKWAAELSPEYLDIVCCVTCTDEESLDAVMQRPRLKHKQSKKRSRAIWL